VTASKPRQKDDDGDVGVGVVPILDSTLGTVSLRVDGRWHHYLAERPRALADALANAVGQPRFDPRSGTLTVRTAATGSRHGSATAFALLDLPVRDRRPAPGILVG